MSMESVYGPGQNVRPSMGQKAHSSSEFATLGNFRARVFDGSGWNGPALNLSADPVYHIIPHAGITVPEMEQ
jgi:hypothetical protein